MKHQTHILIIGLRGAGKSTVGRALAARRQCAFVDLDEAALGQFAQETVMEVWAKHGEGAWRWAEWQSLRELLKSKEPTVIAAGGGLPVSPGPQREIIERRSEQRVRVIWLDCATRVLAERLRLAGGDRPSLTGQPIDEEIDAVRGQRDPVYESLAELTVDTAQKTAAQAAAEINQWLNQRN